MIRFDETQINRAVGKAQALVVTVMRQKLFAKVEVTRS